MERFRTHMNKICIIVCFLFYFSFFCDDAACCVFVNQPCVNLIGVIITVFSLSLSFHDNALMIVRSFGTEDRETPYPIMPQPTVYDYILFRGSDIKDIRVVNNIALPNDPAIMQMHMPPGQMPPQQNFTPQNFPPMQGQPGGAPMGQFGPFGGMQGGNMGPSMSGNMPQQQQAQSPVQQGNSNNSSGSGSGQKSKKPSECSKGNHESTDKSTATQKSRKQSNKSQGVHCLSLTLSLAASFL